MVDEFSDPILSRANALLVIVDMQVGHVPSIRTVAPDRLVAGLVALVRTGISLGIPILVTTGKQPGPNGLLVPELAEAISSVDVVERTVVNAWQDEHFVARVKGTGRTQIIFAGVALEIGVALPALSALKEGYQVFVPVDAVGTTDPRVENAAFHRLSNSGVLLTSVQAIGMELLGDVNDPSAGEVLRILGALHRSGENPFN